MISPDEIQHVYPLP